MKELIYTWNEMSKALKVEQGSDTLPEVKYSYGPRRLGDPAVVFGLNNKAELIIDWIPTRKVADIIRDLSHDKKL